MPRLKEIANLAPHSPGELGAFVVGTAVEVLSIKWGIDHAKEMPDIYLGSTLYWCTGVGIYVTGRPYAERAEDTQRNSREVVRDYFAYGSLAALCLPSAAVINYRNRLADRKQIKTQSTS